MKDHNFTWFREFLERKSGIVITTDKAYLVKSRLTPLLSKYSCSDLNMLSLKMKSNENALLVNEAIDLMTTNETLFFRDLYPFEALKELIFPEIIKQKGSQAPLRIWSAAASRGQEAYSVAMTASEVVPYAGKHVQIVGTDLSLESIDYAKLALYSNVEIGRGIPLAKKTLFFKQVGAKWEVQPRLKKMVQFQVGNLIDDRLVWQMGKFGAFDVVLLRNVLIYFGTNERKLVIDRVARTMKKGSYLITGAADLPVGHTSKWESIVFAGQRIWKLI